MAGLAGYVEDGQLSVEGIECACAALLKFRSVLQSLEIAHTSVFATASLRNISNTKLALSVIYAATGYSVDVLSGEEEALFGFAGAMQKLYLTSGAFLDIGGASTEVVTFEDAAAFFRNMLVNKLDGAYEKLCVSPLGIKTMLMQNIDRQIALGKDGYVCIKANSVTEREIIDKLAEASCAGVEIHLIIRGICCILPGVPDETDNICVTSVVGRFLKHARIYMFSRGSDTDIYISSSDLMTRNLNRRVEIALPIRDERLRKQLRWILNSQICDTAKAGLMLPDGSYCRKHTASAFDSQEYFMHNPSESGMAQ